MKLGEVKMGIYKDFDNDGIPDYLDTDDDNDGIYHSVEIDAEATDLASKMIDLDGDGIPTLSDTEDDGDGKKINRRRPEPQ